MYKFENSTNSLFLFIDINVLNETGDVENDVSESLKILVTGVFAGIIRKSN